MTMRSGFWIILAPRHRATRTFRVGLEADLEGIGMTAPGQQFASGDEAIRVRSAPQTTGPAFTPGVGATTDQISVAAAGAFIAKRRPYFGC